MAKESSIPEVIQKFKVIFGQNKNDAATDDCSIPSDEDDDDDYYDDDYLDYMSTSDSSIGIDDHELMMHLIRHAATRHITEDKSFGRSSGGSGVRKKKGMNERDVPVMHPQIAQKNADELVAAEEREKKKAEKRKAKKKRRREKKKEEKETTTTNIKSKSSNNENSNSVKKEKETAGSRKNFNKSKVNGESSVLQTDHDHEEEEDFLDPNSAFVSVAVNKNKRIASSTAITHMDRSQRVAGARKNSDAEDAVVVESERLAVEGYNTASREQYAEAVDCFTKAIHLVHNDHRFYGNRSFCYCQLGQFAKALKDADKAIKFAALSPKGYYRRGEALKGLKQFKQAEEAFERVVQLDEDCEDAKQELENVKIQQLMEMGFGEDQAFAAIQQYKSVQVAVEMLTAETPVMPQNGTSSADVYYSDDELDGFLGSASAAPRVLQANKMDPSNPEGHLSLWVGNITQCVSEKQLIDLFSRFGVVLSVRLLPEKFCAFINFKDKSAPGPAMKHLQGKEIGGERLLIRYPNNPVPEQIVLKKPAAVASGVSQATTKITGPVNGDECHFWRTTGCAFGSKCRYKHLKESKGIDKKPWQKAV